MSQKLLVLDKYEMPLIEETGGFLNWANGHKNFVGKHAAAFDALTNHLPTGLKVVEYFGGAGVWSTIIANKFRPGYHNIYEYDNDCIKQLGIVMDYLYGDRPMNGVYQADSTYEIGKEDCDVAILDFPSKTVNHYKDFEDGWKNLLDVRKPSTVIWTDLSFRYLHTPSNQKAYTRIMGEPVTDKQSYVKALSRFMWRRHQYSISQCAWNNISFSVRAEPTVTGPNNIVWTEVNNAPPVRLIEAK